MFRSLPCITLLALVVMPLAAQAESGEQRFTLGRYVPADAWLYIHGANNPERAWIDAKWAEVFEEVKSSGIDKDIMGFITSQMPPDQQVAFNGAIDKVLGLVRGVNWSDLCGAEFAFAERQSKSMPIFDYVVLAKGAPGSADANMTGLVNILKELAGLDEAITLTHENVHNMEVHRLRFANMPPAFKGFGVVLFRKGNLFGLVTGQRNVDDVLGLVAGASKGKSLVETARFHQAFAGLPAAENELVFFDCAQFMTAFEGLMASAFAHNPDESGKQAQHMIRAAITRLGILDYIATTSQTDGLRDVAHSVCRFLPEKQNTPLAQAFLGRKPFAAFDKYIPADATSFSLSGAVDFGLLYEAAIGFIKEDVPGGLDAIAQWEAFLLEVGFDPHRDIFDWLSGEMISVGMPPAVATPMGGADGVLMIRVKSPEMAKQKVDSAIGKIASLAAEHGQPLNVSPVPGSDGGLKQVMYGPLAMFIRPVVGIHDEWIVFGTSPEAVRRCMDVAAGKAPSIRQNKRFAHEGITPTGPVYAVSFADTSKTGQEMAQALGMCSMMAAMATAGMPDAPDAREAKQMIHAIANMMMKLAPAAAKINFYSSSASQATINGPEIRTQTITTYKKDMPKPASAL